MASVRELHSALHDDRVTEIDVAPGNWNFSEAEWPSQVVLERNVTMAGVGGPGGAPPYGESRTPLSKPAAHMCGTHLLAFFLT